MLWLATAVPTRTLARHVHAPSGQCVEHHEVVVGRSWLRRGAPVWRSACFLAQGGGKPPHSM